MIKEDNELDYIEDILHTFLLGFIYIVFGGMIVGFTICVAYRIYTNQFWPWLKNGLNDPPSYYVSNNK